MEDKGTRPPKQQSNDDAKSKSKKARPIFDRSLGTAASLSKLLPTGTTLAFQTMAPSFTKGGACEDHDVNFAFTWGLIAFLTLLSAALNFTDSVPGEDGNSHYGVVRRDRLWLFNGRDLRSKVSEDELRRRRLRKSQDILHAVVSAAVFLALAFCDAGVQRCLVKKESRPWKDFFTHLPLAVGFLASFVFIIFPSTRKGIGEDGAWGGDDDEKTNAGPIEAAGNRDGGNQTKKKPEQDERKTTTLLAAASTLSKLLPTGTTLAFQTMAPSFTNGGDCAGHRVNFAFTWGLIGVLTVTCALVTFTDSVTDLDGHTYYGVATRTGFRLFNHDPRDLRLSATSDEAEHRARWRRLQKQKRLRARDFLHAVVSAGVFVAVAFCDAGVQDCLVPAESSQWREFLTLLPLAVAFLASFVFVIFPSVRKGIGEEGTFMEWDITKTTAAPTEAAQQGPPNQQPKPVAMSATQVAPSEGHGDGEQLGSSAV